MTETPRGPAAALALMVIGGGCEATALEESTRSHEKPIPTVSRTQEIRLHNGFVPDPRTLDGTTFERSNSPEPCSPPSRQKGGYRLTLEDAFASLHLGVSADVPTQLVVRYPDTSVRCASAPSQLSTELKAGTYRLWVTALSAGQPHRLSISELPAAANSLAIKTAP